MQTTARPPLLSPGLWYMVGAALSFSLMSLCVKLAGDTQAVGAAAVPIPPMQIVLVRCFVVAVLSFVALRQSGLSARGRNWPALIGRSVAGFTALSLFFFALTRLPLGDATTIQYTSPIWTGLLAAFFLKERSSRIVVLATAVSLTGVALVAKPSFLFAAAGLDGVAAAAALASAILSGVAYTYVRKLRETDAPLVVVFWFAAISVLLSLPIVAMDLVWPTAAQWAALAGVGVAAHLGQVFLTKGLHLEAAGKATAVGYVQIVFAFIWGALFFGTLPDAWTVAGVALVVAAVVLVARRG